MNSEPRLICLIGAECTGKTTLAQALAAQMGGLWVPEYLREFTAQQGRTPLHAEQAHILHEQLRLQDATLEQARQQRRAWVFCDTAPLLTAIYSDCVFGDASQYPEALVLHSRYAYTLLLEPDIPWVADGLQRDGAAMRATVHARILRCLHDAGLPYTCIAGDAKQRLQGAMNAING
ncbi:MAG: ATP-binding protein [Burkholderiales bacterium]|nr:ATP-binding protein [Burkholderiales bacterium]